MRLIVFLLFFASGFAGLVYEVLWMKELGLLFGNTAHAAATTLAAFFVGIASGSLVIGRYAARSTNPLRLYALCEAGVTISGLLYFLLLDLYYTLYSPLFAFFGPGAGPFLFAKFGLSILILFPPAFFMGGTLPAMSQYLVHRADTLGKTASVLYGINTLGAACGAFAAGFYLPRALGFTHAYWVALVLTGCIAVVAWALGARALVVNPVPTAAAVRTPVPPKLALGAREIRLLALLSGFMTLALEVLWTRMFAQVFQNSVYTFTIILVTFLAALAIGAGVARLLLQRNLPPAAVLLALIITGALLVAASPFTFIYFNEGLSYFGADLDWWAYVAAAFAVAAAVILPAAIVLGSIFPYLIKASEMLRLPAGRTVGDLASINTLGAVAGSLVAGFILLDAFGLWNSIRICAAVYLLTAFLLLPRLPALRTAAAAAAVAGLVALGTLFNSSRLPMIQIGGEHNNEQLVEILEGSAGTVAVVDRDGNLRIKLNNFYGLGGSGSFTHEQRQAHLPLLVHQDASDVFFLGMGTGITAGGALSHPVEHVTVAELVPEVVTLSRRHFGPFLNGLFTDPRAQVVTEDGRNYLLGTTDSFDAIIADLFVPYRSGVGSLYSVEHYRAALQRLKPGGVYAQWLALYQMSKTEFDIIARTMLEVFPMVTLWRGDFFGQESILMLLGHESPTVLSPESVNARLAKVDKGKEYGTPERIGYDAVPESLNSLLLHYAGNLTQARDLFEHAPLNTDDRPIIEFAAPVNHRAREAGTQQIFGSTELMKFLQLLQQTAPVQGDPFLAAIPETHRVLSRAGLDLHTSIVLRSLGDKTQSTQAFDRFRHVWEDEALWPE